VGKQKMKGVLGGLILILLLSSCRGPSGCTLSKQDLRLQIENVWWELLETPFVDDSEGKVCVLFESEDENSDKIDGKSWYHTELGGSDEYISDFKRKNNGFYLFDYDTDVIIFMDSEGDYFAELETGFFVYNKTIPFAPCDFLP
tara:strand:- start:171 stop:602 length:432 start_codon:yes stop_codon:yes gene_type:complete